MRPISRLGSTTDVDVVIGLPLRNRALLDEEIREIYDPSSDKYRNYLTPEQFTARFGPTEEDYQTLLNFARDHRLAVVLTHPNRTLLHVRGAAADVEKTFQVRICVYQHPAEARTFYAPDVEPSVDLKIPFLHISGLNDFTTPRRTLRVTPIEKGAALTATGGSGGGGLLAGADFRAAYAPGVTLTGSGQVVGVLDLDTGYFANDIRAYEANFGLPNVPLQNVNVGGFTGAASSSSANLEISLDMEMIIAMAPGISKLVVYGAPDYGYAVDLLNEMANPTQGEPWPNQLSTSFALYYDPNVYQALAQLARQGQSFFAYSGDNGAYTDGIMPFPPGDHRYVTCVGGTVLTTSGPGGTWVSETAWSGSGGGPSPWGPADPEFAFPQWQEGIDMSALGGSTTSRNCPDVAMVSENVLVIYNNGSSGGIGGTSVATPLWAGFAALINQHAASVGKPPIGFINPALYSVGKGETYADCFHDITSGNNTHGAVTDKYFAVRGYDLVTGWGTPRGAALIKALSGVPDDCFVAAPILTVPNPYSTVRAAYNAAPDCSIIRINAGNYHEAVTPFNLNKRIRLESRGGPATITR